MFWNSECFSPASELLGGDSLSPYTESGLYDCVITWGRFLNCSTVSEATEVSGSLSKGKGAEIIRRVIRFNQKQGSLQTISDRKSIEWVFRTAIYSDGIAVDIVTPRPIPVLNSSAAIEVSFETDISATAIIDEAYTEPDPVEVVYQTGPFRSTFAPEEIGALDKVC